MNQYQACLYLNECISHGDAEYGHENSKMLNFLKNYGTFVDLSSAHAFSIVSVNI